MSTSNYLGYNVRNKEKGAKRVPDTVYFKHKYITNPTVIPEDADIQAEQKLPASPQGNLQTAMDESGIVQLIKFDDMFNTTANNSRKQNERQHPHTGQKNPAPAQRAQWEPNPAPRVI